MVATFYTEHYTNINLDIIIDKYGLNRFSNLGDIEWCCADWCKNFGSGAERYLMNPENSNAYQSIAATVFDYLQYGEPEQRKIVEY